MVVQLFLHRFHAARWRELYLSAKEESEMRKVEIGEKLKSSYERKNQEAIQNDKIALEKETLKMQMEFAEKLDEYQLVSK